MSKPKIAIVIGSTRAEPLRRQAGRMDRKIAKERGDLDIEVVDLRDYPLPFFDEVGSSLYVPSQNEVAQRWQKKVARYDGFIFTAAEYNRGPTAVLKNALDYAYTEWNRKPAASSAMAASAARGRSSSFGCMRSSCRWRRPQRRACCLGRLHPDHAAGQEA